MVFRILFAVVAYFDLEIDQIDIKTVFLYKLIHQLVYINIPKGSESKAIQEMVCKLAKVFYSLKQAPRFCYEMLLEFFFPKLGLVRINTDHSIFISVVVLNGHEVSTFVDDIKIMPGKKSDHIT